jgi:FkbM family methyltransferase
MEQFTLVRPLGWNFELEVPIRNINWYLNGYEKFTARIFAQFCKDSDTIIDVGAHVGFYSLIASEANPVARIIAIEPSPINVQVLEKNLSANELNIEVIKKVFSNVKTEVDFELTEASDNSCVGGSPTSLTTDILKIETVIGDDLLIDLDSRITIKLDIEGSELIALESLDQVLRMGKEVKLILEYNPASLLKNKASIQKFFEKINYLGFRVFSLSDENCEWKEIIFPEIPDATVLNQMGYVNLACLKSKLTFSGVLHSGALYGGERNYLELVSQLISEGHLVHSVLPSLDLGLAEKLYAVGSSVSMSDSITWWVDRELEMALDPLEASPFFYSNFVSLDTISKIKKVSPDAIISSSLVIPQGAIAAAALDLPHIWWIQEFGDIDHGMRLPFERYEFGQLLICLSDSVITVSESVKKHFFSSENEIVNVIYPQPQIDLDLRSGNRKGEVFRFAVIGSFQYGKGHDDLLDAIPYLSDYFGQFEVSFYGTGSESDVKRLREKIATKEVKGHVTIKSFDTDRGAIYSNLDAVIVTSRNEAFGRVPLEAIQYGVNVIYANSAGPSEYMTNGVNGLAYSPEDSISLAKALSFFMANPNLASKLILNHHKIMEKISENGSIAKQFIKSLSNSTKKTIDEGLKNSILISISLSERDRAIAERDRAIAERDRAIAERDRAIAERDSVINSTIWKITKPYRKLRSLF